MAKCNGMRLAAFLGKLESAERATQFEPVLCLTSERTCLEPVIGINEPLPRWACAKNKAADSASPGTPG